MREEAIAMASTSPLSILSGGPHGSPRFQPSKEDEIKRAIAPITLSFSAGKLILFAPRLPADYADWLGDIKLLSYFRINILSMLSCSLCQVISASYVYILVGRKGIWLQVTDLTNLHPILTECCVFKSDLELTLIQVANDVSSEAHVE
ncbi:hypothetical protein Goklo_010027, partial [Gossypium klotzschianum]|nr:hypothetical protein [Gossypium klotzschianum]